MQEHDVRALLERSAATPNGAHGIEAAWARGRARRRAKRLVVAAGASLTTVAAVVVVSGALSSPRVPIIDQEPTRPDPSVPDGAVTDPDPDGAPTDEVHQPPPVVPSAPGWAALPPSPLSARAGAVALWTGSEVLLIGGDAQPCAAGHAASCAMRSEQLRDGAAYDPATGAWRMIAEAPVLVMTSEAVMVGRTAYLWVATGTADGQLLAYHVDEDRWQQLPAPPGPPNWWRLVGVDGALVAYHDTNEWQEEADAALLVPDLVLDLEAETWSLLPADPLYPSSSRSMVWADDRLVLVAVPLDGRSDSSVPPLYRAATLEVSTGTWTELPPSEVVGWEPTWLWAGGYVVNPTVGSSDGGQVNNWGRSYPHGGMLDPVTGTWASLPAAPGDDRGYLLPPAAGDEVVVSSSAVALHVASGTWTRLDLPDGFADEGMATVWAGDRLFVWGGVSFGEGGPLDRGWTWTPG